MSAIHDYLRELIGAGARADPLVFSGRLDEIDRIVLTAANPPPKGPRGCTFLIHGAPGSGKTAFISEVCRRLEGVPGAGALSLASVPVDSTADRTYGHLASLLVGAARPGHDRTETAMASIEGSVGFARAGASETARVSSPTYFSAEDIACDRGAAWRPKERVVLFVDEVQMLKPGSRAAELLFDLHTQASIPVLLVCAGLGNSRLALSNAGFSRLENLLPLGKLAEAETMDCAHRSLRKVAERGVRASAPGIERWAAALARSADNWPRHLQVFLHAAWQVLLGQKVPNLDEADLEAALAIGGMRRAEYYQDRIAASRTPLEIIAALHREMEAGNGLMEQEADRLIGRTVESLDSIARKEWEAQFDGRPRNCFEALLRAGVVSLDSMYRCTSPVPSFSRHILDLAGARPAAP